MAKQTRQEEPVTASLNPSEMLAGGLKDDFRGIIKEAVYERWDYDGTVDPPVLAVRLTIQELDDQGEEVEGEGSELVQRWSAGDLAAFVPSQDGKTPADEDEVGPYAVRVGKRSQLNNNTNFAHLMNAILEIDSKHFGAKQLTASLECLESLDAHWNRVPQKKRSGLVEEDGEGKKKGGRDVLVVTEIFGYGGETDKKAAKKGAAAGTKSSKATSKKAKDEDEEEAEAEDEDEEEAASEKSPLDQKLIGIIKEELGDDGTIKKGKLAKLALDALAKDKDKAKGVKRITESDFLSALDSDEDGLLFDEDEGTITAIS